MRFIVIAAAIPVGIGASHRGCHKGTHRERGLVSVYFLNKNIPNIMGPFYVHWTPNIMDPFYVLSTMGLSYVHQTHHIMGLFM